MTNWDKNRLSFLEILSHATVAHKLSVFVSLGGGKWVLDIVRWDEKDSNFLQMFSTLHLFHNNFAFSFDTEHLL